MNPTEQRVLDAIDMDALLAYLCGLVAVRSLEPYRARVALGPAFSCLISPDASLHILAYFALSPLLLCHHGRRRRIFITASASFLPTSKQCSAWLTII